MEKKIIELLEAGAYLSVVAKAVGVNQSTLRVWMHIPQFRSLVKKAEAVAEQKCLEKINVAASQPRNWTAAAWILERRWPERWAKKESWNVKASIDKEHPIATIIPPGCTLDLDIDTEDSAEKNEQAKDDAE